MKKLLLTLVGVICSLGMWAGDYGFSSTISGTTVSAPAVTNTDGITVAVVRGSKNQTGSGKGSMYWGSTTALTFTGTAERTQYNPGTGNVALPTNAFVDDVWTGASFVIPTGKILKATHIHVQFAGQDYKWHYKVSVLDGDGTVVNTPRNGGGVTPKTSSALALDEDFTADLSGTVYVKVHFYNETSSNSKYFAVPVITLTGTLEDAGAQTQYSKPTITVGAYDQPSGTYAVTLNVQNDEDGTIDYTVGSSAEVTGVAPGTVINVAPNTTIVATVSGSTYAESDEASTTTAAAPKLAKPTSTIGGYDFESGKYNVTLACQAGAHIWYRIGGGDWTSYTSEFAAQAGATVEAQAKQNNMTASDVLSVTMPAAPQDGTSATPQTAGLYTDGMTYNAGAFTIPSTNSYIGATISSGNSSINNSIKMRISRNADPSGSQDSKYGFHILVNPGYMLTGINLKILNNYNTQIALVGVYADNSSDNLLASPVDLPYASANSIPAAQVNLTNMTATQKVVFVFEKTSGSDNPNQAQVVISADAIVPVMNTGVTADNFGTIYYPNKELVCPDGTKAYTGTLSGDALVLTELPDGVIPAGTPAVFNGNGGLFTLGKSGAPAVVSSLQGVAVPTEVSEIAGGTVCVLGYENSQTNFYKFNGTTLAANKAYLVVPTSASAIRISFGEATAIKTVDTTANNTVRYNLAGQRVNANAKGIVVVNGKKMLNK